jgi:hypothetical protein
MKTSESIKSIAPALLEAQKNIDNAVKDSKNPFFKSSYADVNSVIEACKHQLNSVGISIHQPVESDTNSNFVITRLQHTSGEFMETSMLLLPVKNMQELGSAITYARRYSLQSWMLMGAVDDDAELSMNRSTQAAPRNYVAPRIVENKVESKPQAVAMPIPVAPTGGFKSAKITKVENEEF